MEKRERERMGWGRTHVLKEVLKDLTGNVNVPLACF